MRPSGQLRQIKAPLSTLRSDVFMREASEISPAEWTQLARFDDHWRVVLEDDQPVLVWNLAKGGYLEVLKRRVPLYRLSPTGRETLKWRSSVGVLAKPEPGTLADS